MANSIAYAVKYLEMLDRIYKAAAVTSVLEAAATQYRLDTINEKTVYLKKMALQGLGDYSRTNGYDAGDATVTWEAHTFAIERSKMFNLDTMDAKEAYTQITELAAEFQRVHVAPEIDAYRFEKICTLCSLDVSADLTDDTAIAAIDTAIETLDDAEVPKEGRVMFISNEMYRLMKQSGEFINTRLIETANAINRNITTFDEMPLIKVPKARFYNNFDFTASGAGGFAPAGGSKQLNFIIAYAPAVLGILRHVSPKIITPDQNQSKDGWLYGYRLVHDLFIPEQKVNGIYIHSKS
jgi:hypothetical protein